MKKKKMVMTVIVTFCLIIMFVPMGVASAGNGETTQKSVLSTSLAGTLLAAGADSISADVSGLNSSKDENMDESPDTSDKTPIFIVTTIAVISFIAMATVCLKEYNI